MKTPKQRVLEHFPDAYCLNLGTRAGWTVWSTRQAAGVWVYQLNSGNSTPTKAWAAAWEKTWHMCR